MSDINMNSTVLPFTGERYVPQIGGNLELEHLHRYLLARQIVAGKSVLDIACGEGYGSSLLANSALKVIGVDISKETIVHAQKMYQNGNLEFKAGSCADIPLSDASVDAVVSFETIEHHDQHEEMMREIKRVLKPGGVLIISSPDRLEYSDKPKFSNPYHVKELYRYEFEKLLATFFERYVIYGQRVMYGSVILSEDNIGETGCFELADTKLQYVRGVPHAIYLIAVASDAEPPTLLSGLLEQPISEAEPVVGIYASIYASRSWRLTRPLRFLSHLTRKLRAMFSKN